MTARLAEPHVAVLDCGHRVHTTIPLPKGETCACSTCAAARPILAGPGRVARVVTDSCAIPCEREQRRRRR